MIAFVVAMKNKFGFKPGQTLKEFGDEMKALTPEDKHEFCLMLRSEGVDVADPAPAVAQAVAAHA